MNRILLNGSRLRMSNHTERRVLRLKSKQILVEGISATKSLSMYIDLKWEDHVQELPSKTIAPAFSVAKRIMNFVPGEILLTFYNH